MQGRMSAPHTVKTNSKFILELYDKNLLQKYGGSVTCEIPFDGYFLADESPISVMLENKTAARASPCSGHGH